MKMFKPKEYQYSIPFTGNAKDALSVARTSLLSLGFEVSLVSESEVYATGPGMHSTQQPDLLGVSTLRLQIEASAITASARLGGAANMKAFVYLFPPALTLILLTVFNLVGMGISWRHALWVLAWGLIAPWIGNSIERKTTRAVDILVRGMAQST